MLVVLVRQGTHLWYCPPDWEAAGGGAGAGGGELILQDYALPMATPTKMSSYVDQLSLGNKGNLSALFHAVFVEIETSKVDEVLSSPVANGIIKPFNEDSFSGGDKGEIHYMPGSPQLAQYESPLGQASDKANGQNYMGEVKKVGLFSHAPVMILPEQISRM